MRNKLTLTVLGLLTLSGCSGVRETLGLERTPPNEFAVTPSQVSLEMPPDFYTLPAPQPGAPRPQEIAQHQKTKQILMGQSVSQDPKVSAGQSALLQEAGVIHGRDDVRHQVNSEAELEARRGGTIVEQLKLRKKKVGETLKPKDEQKRLQEAGIPTSGYVEYNEETDKKDSS